MRYGTDRHQLETNDTRVARVETIDGVTDARAMNAWTRVRMTGLYSTADSGRDHSEM